MVEVSAASKLVCLKGKKAVVEMCFWREFFTIKAMTPPPPRAGGIPRAARKGMHSANSWGEVSSLKLIISSPEGRSEASVRNTRSMSFSTKKVGICSFSRHANTSGIEETELQRVWGRLKDTVGMLIRFSLLGCLVGGLWDRECSHRKCAWLISRPLWDARQGRDCRGDARLGRGRRRDTWQLDARQ